MLSKLSSSMGKEGYIYLIFPISIYYTVNDILQNSLNFVEPIIH